MTIDERLDRLTIRQEALTESHELLTRDVRERQASVKATFGVIAESIGSLLEIVQSHERRPNDSKAAWDDQAPLAIGIKKAYNRPVIAYNPSRSLVSRLSIAYV